MISYKLYLTKTMNGPGPVGKTAVVAVAPANPKLTTGDGHDLKAGVAYATGLSQVIFE